MMVLVFKVAEEDVYWNHSVIAYDDVETFIKVYASNADFLNRGKEDFDELMNIKKELEQNGQYCNNWDFRTYFYAREVPDGTFKNGEDIFEPTYILKQEDIDDAEETWQKIQQKYAPNSAPVTQQTPNNTKSFTPITEKEFAMRFLAVLMEDDSCHKEKITKIFQKEQDYVKTVYEYMDSDTPLYSDVFDQFFTDLDVDFCFENHHCSPRRSKILGFRTLDNGLTFLGIEAAGDWEIAVTCIMYWDGNDFRGYVPKNGNCWNYLNNKAFWNDHEADWKYLKQYCPEKAQAIEQKAQGKKWNGSWGSREAWLASSDWADYDFYYDLIDEDKMLEEIKKVFP